jgi:hypothetical protein
MRAMRFVIFDEGDDGFSKVSWEAKSLPLRRVSPLKGLLYAALGS